MYDSIFCKKLHLLKALFDPKKKQKNKQTSNVLEFNAYNCGLELSQEQVLTSKALHLETAKTNRQVLYKLMDYSFH